MINIKKILIIEPNWLGDILFTTPAIRAIREQNPDAYIACMTHPRCAEMLEGNSCINEIIFFDERHSHKSILKKISFIKKLKSYKFDIVLSFHRSMTKMLICYLAGIPRRVGYLSKKRSFLLTDPVFTSKKAPHRVEYFLNIARSIGVDTKNKNYEFSVSDDDIKDANRILEKEGISKEREFLIVNPGGNWHPKRWSKENYSKLIKKISEIYKKRIVITGSKKDVSLADSIIKEANINAINLAGKTTLKQLAGIMRRSVFVISNDSGPMHIAVSQNVPTIALFGPTSPDITGPYGDSNYTIIHNKPSDCDVPCYKECEDYRCMEAITVYDVLEALDRIANSS